MKITVFGTGYVGLVTSICFSEMGNDVSCVDIDRKKLELLQQGRSPIFEQGLEPLLAANLKAQRIQFTDDARQSVERAEIIFIAVGTPSLENGSADLKSVFAVAETIADNMTSYKLIVTKSTVPMGTGQKIKALIQERLTARGESASFDVASNPEFLREGTAIDDCLRPNRVVVGVENNRALSHLQKLYEPFLKNGNPFIGMDLASAEMTKYAANTMLAARITIMNEFSRLCEKTGADIESVRRGIGSDFRIGPHFIYAGLGYGGSCFPKDVRALVNIGKEHNEELAILQAVEKTNSLQRRRFSDLVLQQTAGKTVAIWGVSFKPGTDDIRDAPSLEIIDSLLKNNYQVRVFDPVASENARLHFKNHAALSFYDDQYLALDGSSALVIPTEWKSFREPDFERMKSLMRVPLIFDGRNIYTPQYIAEKGFRYFSIGRPSS